MADSHKSELSSMECRICHGTSTRGLIISPCLCKGSLANVHVSCLERWLNQAFRDSCELCGRRYAVAMRRRHSGLGSVRCWLRQPACRARLILHLCSAAVLTALILALVVLSHLAISKIHDLDQRMQDNNSDHIGSDGPSWSWFEAVVGVSLGVVLVAYLNVMYAMVSNNVGWWHACNRHITLVLDNYEVLDSTEKSAEETVEISEDCNNNFETDKIHNDVGVIEELETRIENIV